MWLKWLIIEEKLNVCFQKGKKANEMQRKKSLAAEKAWPGIKSS